MPAPFWQSTHRGYNLIQWNQFGPIEIWFKGEYIETSRDGRCRDTINAWLNAA
jgi:hypothetical protein